MGSLELFHLYHHFIILHDAAAQEKDKERQKGKLHAKLWETAETHWNQQKKHDETHWIGN